MHLFFIICNAKKCSKNEWKCYKSGDCIFPFKNSKHTDPKQYDCVKGEEDSSWCATEIKPNLMKTKWGYCVPEGMTLEEYNSLYEN